LRGKKKGTLAPPEKRRDSQKDLSPFKEREEADNISSVFSSSGEVRKKRERAGQKREKKPVVLPLILEGGRTYPPFEGRIGRRETERRLLSPRGGKVKVVS